MTRPRSSSSESRLRISSEVFCARGGVTADQLVACEVYSDVALHLIMSGKSRRGAEVIEELLAEEKHRGKGVTAVSFCLTICNVMSDLA